MSLMFENNAIVNPDGPNPITDFFIYLIKEINMIINKYLSDEVDSHLNQTESKN